MTTGARPASETLSLCAAFKAALAGIEGEPNGYGLANRAVACLAVAGEKEVVTPPPRRVPAHVLLPGLVALAPQGPLRSLVEQLVAWEPQAAWRQNPNYTPENVGQHYLDGYGYLELAGPEGVIVEPALRIGLLVIGPHRTYPRHSHPAEEIYLPLAGHAQWWRTDRDWTTSPPGTLIYHAPHVAHATRTEHEPLLAAYVWGGDIGPAARLNDMPTG